MDTGKLYGLIFGCPFGDCMDDCPLKQIRKFPIEKRLDYIEALSVPEKEKLVELHNTRYVIREKERVSKAKKRDSK
jgi:hypothetical protein